MQWSANSQVAVHQAGHRRLDVILADRRADQTADRLFGDAGSRQHLFGGQGGQVAGLLTGIPEAPFPNAGESFDEAGFDAHAFHGIGQLRFDIGRGDNRSR
jgi:hypothetical protein